MDILQRSLKALEWEKLAQHLADNCETEPGRFKVQSITFAPGIEEAKRLLRETDEAQALLRSRTSLSFASLPPVAVPLIRARTGAILSGPELSNLKRMLDLAKAVQGSLSLLDSASFAEIPKLVPKLHVVEALRSACAQMIDQEGVVKDDATPKLANLRNDFRRAHQRIKEELNKLIHNSTVSKALQESLFTQRSGRYVLPVDASMRSSVPGIVHDTSVSGLTLYIEPVSVIEKTNDARMLEVEIDREVERILAELSQIAHTHIEELDEALEALASLDMIFARARLGISYDGMVPSLSEESNVNLIALKHPLLVLLKKQGVIANDFELGSSSPSHAKTLVITGPNTGGKTVFLKSIGLACLMVKAGLMIPAGNGSTISFFRDVLADIGDEQSLEQSLSTFSSHLNNIIEIVHRASTGCLVLLDEIGAGTDPREGSALAQATLEHLNQCGAVTVVTTHVGELKTLAFSQAGFINGSFEFDLENLEPTYQFRMGTPGASQATKIAKRLGLSDGILLRTEELLTVSESAIDDTVKQLEERLLIAKQRECEAEESLLRANKLEQELLLKIAVLEEQGSKDKATANQKITGDLDAARDLVREITAKLQKEPSLPGARQAQVQLDTLRKQLGWTDAPLREKTAPRDLKTGDPVQIISINRFGVIKKVTKSSQNGSAFFDVQVGNMKLVVSDQDVKLLTEKKPAKEEKRTVIKPGSSAKIIDRQRVVREPFHPDVFVRTGNNTLDLRGCRVDEALSKLASFIDKAVSDSIYPAMIIHGHGTGALRSAVRDELKASPYELKFRPGENYEGGDGVTVVLAR
jgi:DNA mismatch repair protein MutS2